MIMALVTMNETVKKAYLKDYAVPGFNVFSFFDANEIIAGAEEMHSPVLIMTSGSCIKAMGVETAAGLYSAIAKRSKVPTVLHLDHADDIDVITKAIHYGYSSVMYDGSMLSFEENMRNTKFVVKMAHALGVSVEAEIGRVGKGEDGEDVTAVLTEPEMAKKFYEETSVDALAIAVGTSHGMQKQEAEIHYEIIEEVSRTVDVPLVLHGSSGVKNEDLEKISRFSFGKINIGTRLKNAFCDSIRENLQNDPAQRDYHKLLLKSAKSVKEVVKDKIKYVGSAEKA